jgi:hypothetical protein
LAQKPLFPFLGDQFENTPNNNNTNFFSCNKTPNLSGTSVDVQKKLKYTQKRIPR